jgi:hypothetical protein
VRAGVALLVLGLISGCGRIGFDLPGEDAGAGRFELRDLCAFARQTVVTDGEIPDDQTGADMASALDSACPALPAARTVSQDDPGILDPITNRPVIAADDLAVLGGGDGPQRGLAYLLQDDTPVAWSSTASTATFTERATGRVLVADGPLSPTHDYPLLMVVVEPIGGTHVLSASGMEVRGTIAAGFWFATRIAPVLATVDTVWVLLDWTNADADPDPSAGDTFTVIASG